MDKIDALLSLSTDACDQGKYEIGFNSYLETLQTIVDLLKEKYHPSRNEEREEVTALLKLSKLCIERSEELVDLVPFGKATSGVVNNRDSSPSPTATADRRETESILDSFRKTYGIDLPLIPKSPLIQALQETEEKLLEAQSKFEALQVQGSSGDGKQRSVSPAPNNPSFLGSLRRALENVEMLVDKRKRLDLAVKTFGVSGIDFIRHPQLEPKLLAQQLTLIDDLIFKKIKPDLELCDGAWMKPGQKRQLAPNVSASIDFFNYVSHWVQFEILSPLEVLGRANVYQYFVKVAQCLSEHCSFNMLKAVVLALKSGPVLSLKEGTMKAIPKKILVQVDTLEAMLSEDRNYSYLRTILKRKPSPAIPFLGLFLHDLTFVEEAYKSGIEISSPGAHQVAETLDLIGYFQSSTFPFLVDLNVQHFILTRPFNPMAVLFNLSQEREPRPGFGGGASGRGGGSGSGGMNARVNSRPGSSAGIKTTTFQLGQQQETSSKATTSSPSKTLERLGSSSSNSNYNNAPSTIDKSKPLYPKSDDKVIIDNTSPVISIGSTSLKSSSDNNNNEASYSPVSATGSLTTPAPPSHDPPPYTSTLVLNHDDVAGPSTSNVKSTNATSNNDNKISDNADDDYDEIFARIGKLNTDRH